MPSLPAAASLTKESIQSLEVAVLSGGNGSWFERVSSAFRQGRKDLRELFPDPQLDSFPLRKTLRGYGRRTFFADLRAAGTVGLLALLQGMAYAVVAGLPLHYGITCSAVAAIVGPLLASSRYSILGPTNATAFMIFSYFAAFPNLNRLELMPMLLFLTSALLIVGAYLRVADLAQYISRTVVVAYITGAALLIAVNQLPSVLGVTLVEADDGHRAVTLPGVLYRIVLSLGSLRWTSAVCAAVTLGIYFIVKKWRPTWPAFAIALVGATVLTTAFAPAGFNPPTFSDGQFTWRELLPVFPDFATAKALPNLSRLFGISVALAFLCTMENSMMGRALAGRSGRRVDGNQDMLSLGVANLACAYLSGMPASNSPTRSTLNFECHARTPIASIMSGVICLIGALTLGSAVAYVPKAALSVLVITIAASLINRRNIRICMASTRSDAMVFLVTLIAAMMVPLHVAIFTGVGVSIILYLRKASRPSLVEYAFNTEGQLAEAQKGARAHPSISIVHVEGDLFFGAAELFRTQIQRTCADPNLRIIVLRLKNARHLDATSVMALEELIRVLRLEGRDLIVSGAMKDVYRVLRDSGLVDVIGKSNIFLGSASNPNISTRNALRRAQEILGRSDADVRIYFDPSQQKSAP